MRLRSHLSILVVAAVVPLLIFSTVMVFVFNKQQRAAVENSLLDTARALSLAIDREITASIHTLEALATSDDLDSGDLGKFYEQAARVLKAREDWDNILLADSSGRQLLNLRRPFGSPLPPVGELEEFQRVIKTSRPVVSDLYFGRVSQKYLIGVSAPVVRKGKARYVLMSSRRPMSLLRILAQQNIAPHWLGTIADNKGIIVARTRNIEQMIGKAAMPVPRADDESANESLSLGAAPDGTAVELAFRRSELTGWSVRLAIPASDLEAPLRHTLAVVIGGGLTLLLAGVGMAAFFGRRISKSIAGLSNAAAALGRSELPQTLTSPIIEVNNVARVIEDAATERQHAEESIRQQSRLLDLYFQYALNPVVFLDRDFNFIRVNEAYARACQRDVSEFPGHNHFEFYPSEAKAIFEEVVKTKKPFQTFTHPFVFPDHPEWGITYWDWTLVPILDDSGEVELLVFSLNDVTQRKQTEEALTKTTQTLQALVHASPVGIDILDTDGNVKLWNPAAERMFGWKEAEILGHALPIIPEDKQEEFRKAYGAVLQGHPFTEVETYRQRKDGSLIHVSISAGSIRDPNGNILGTMGILIDITERKRAETNLRNSRAQLRALAAHLQSVREEERKKIARELHDESGQLLASVHIGLSEMEREFPSTSSLKKLAEVKDLLTQIEEHLRNLSHELYPNILDDLGLLPALQSLAGKVSGRTGIRIKLEGSPNGRLRSSIETTLYRTVQEALNNVVKHANATTVNVKLLEADGLVHCSIQDDGVGFDVLKVLGQRTREGLGLVAIRERVENLDGTIKIHSAPNQGTQLHVAIPIER